MSTEITKDADALELPVEEIPAVQEPFVIQLPPQKRGEVKYYDIRNNSDRTVVIYPATDATLHLEE